MFAYGICIGKSGKYDVVCRPSLDRNGAGFIVERRNQRSIFEAYLSIAREALSKWPTLEGLVLLHDDVELQDKQLEHKLRRLFSDERIGIVGVVGGVDHADLSWWTTTELHGHCRDDTTTEHDYSHGDHMVTAVDGLFMVFSPKALTELLSNLQQGGYPNWHGYDSEMCAVVRQAGLSVIVSDIGLYHHCKPEVPWRSAEYRQAVMEWRLRWRSGSRRTRFVWTLKRHCYAAVARLG